MAIADMILSDKELCLGEFLAPNGKARIDSKWQEIASIVNAMPGARKSPDMWRVVSAFTEPYGAIALIAVLVTYR